MARRECVCHTPPLHQTDLITDYANRATCVILISEFGLKVLGYQCKPETYSATARISCSLNFTAMARIILLLSSARSPLLKALN